MTATVNWIEASLIDDNVIDNGIDGVMDDSHTTDDE